MNTGSFTTSLRIETSSDNSWVLRPHQSVSMSPQNEAQHGEEEEKVEIENKPSPTSYFWFGTKKRSIKVNTKSRQESSSLMGESKDEDEVVMKFMEPLSPMSGGRYHSEDRPEVCQSPLARFVDFVGEAHIMPSLSKLIEQETGFYLSEQARQGDALNDSLAIPEADRIIVRRDSSDMISPHHHSFTMSPRDAAPPRTHDIPSIRLD
jgi:hypothetical protein